MVAAPRLPLRLVLLLCLAGCGGVQEGSGGEADAGDNGGDGDGDGADAGMDASGGIDAGDDGGPADADVADAACLPRAIFLGGTAPEDQGWMVTSSGSANISTAGPSITTLETQTIGTTGAQLLISLPDAVEPGQPFAVELVMQVMAVNTHNFLDGAAVLMGSYSGPFGSGDDRAEMLYVDAVEIGWTDDTQTAAADAIDGMFHTYVLAVDAAGNATISRDDVELLSRAGFTTNGTIAFGDQTNDPNIESTLWIRSVTLLCP